MDSNNQQYGAASGVFYYLTNNYTPIENNGNGNILKHYIKTLHSITKDRPSLQLL